MLVHLVLLTCFALTHADPIYGRRNDLENMDNMKVLYDQKQEGEWNIQADLKNFLFVIIPTVKSAPSNSTSSPTSTALEQGLLYLLSKSAGSRKHHHQPPIVTPTEDDGEEEEESPEETKHFIESKSAPYQVDISKTSGGILSKLYPEKAESDGVLVAKSPTISLLKDPVSGRVAKALLLTVPDEEIIITKTHKTHRKKAREDHLKKGDANIGCQPGQVRDSYGNCKVYKY